MIEWKDNYRVKFVNNKSFWYWCDEECRIGDLVYCTGSQEGILGKIIEISDRVFANQKIISKTGHIQIEKTDEIEDLWETLEKDDLNRIMISLGQKEPFSRVKFINCVSNFWTVKGSEGMEWKDYLPFVISYSRKWKPAAAEPVKYDDCISYGGFLWKPVQDLPEIERIDRDLLINGVLYGTAEMIESMKERYKIENVVEFIPGIYRAAFDDADIMTEYPELKIAFFYVTRNDAYAVYSESGYPYLTKEVYTPVKMDHGEGYSYINHYFPDEVFRDTSSSYDPDHFDVRFNSPFDKEFRTMDYVVNKNGSVYQMAGIDHDNPPYTKNKDWVYQIDGSEAVIHRYRGHREELFFPAEIEGKRVKGIADRFGKEDDSYTRIKRIVLPEGYRYIGAYAFAGCKSLREAVLPSTVRVIGDGAFLKCAKLREITLPDSLAEIYHDYDDKSGGRFMFKGCTSLKIASIPEELSYYDGHPFEECTKVCMRLNDCKPSLIRMCVIDHRDKEMEEVSTDHIYAGAKLIIHHNEQENRIELLSSLTQYVGYIVKEEEFDFVPVTEFKEYPDHKQIRIISVSKCYFDNCVSEVEFVLE